jgi:hypothetical protein
MEKGDHGSSAIHPLLLEDDVFVPADQRREGWMRAEETRIKNLD